MTKLIAEYKPLFDNSVGKIKEIQARLRLKDRVTPVFAKSRPVPFAISNQVNDELESLIQQGILEPVNTSQWASAIVPVVKSNGKIRICGTISLH